MALFADLYRWPETTEATLEEPFGADAERLNVYLEINGVDPTRQSIAARLEFSTKRGSRGLHYPSQPDRDMTVQVSDGAYVLDVALPAGRSTPSTPVHFGVTGSVSSYPFDSYRGQVLIAAWEGPAPEGRRVPIRLTVWEDIAAWDVTISARPAEAGADGLALTIKARRPPSHVYFAIVVYAVMCVIALCGLTIGALLIIGRRKIEAALMGALAAMLFAVPALRNATPGSPPLGVAADAFIFLWVQVALMIGLALAVLAWAREGPAP